MEHSSRAFALVPIMVVLTLVAGASLLEHCQALARRTHGRTLQQMYFGDNLNNLYTLQKSRFLRKHVNDLDALLKFVVNGGVVTTTVFNKAYRDFAANWYYSLARFGRARDIVLVAYDTESLVDCLSLGFACYNGTKILVETKAFKGEFVSKDVSHGNKDYHMLMWGKPLIMYEILRRNYTCHFSDLDTVWFKDAVRSMLLAADAHDADVIGMNDQNTGNPNAGNLFIRHNVRTIKMMERWLAEGRKGGETLRSDVHDQQGLWAVKGTGWDSCKNTTECLALKQKGMAALWLHPWHGCPWDHVDYNKTEIISKFNWTNGICDNQLAYLHIFCTAGGVKHKHEMANNLGMWFVDKDSLAPIMKHAPAMDLIVLSQNYSYAKLHSPSGLPCENDVAWLGL